MAKEIGRALGLCIRVLAGSWLLNRWPVLAAMVFLLAWVSADIMHWWVRPLLDTGKGRP